MPGVFPLGTEQSGAGDNEDSKRKRRRGLSAGALLASVAWPAVALAEQVEAAIVRPFSMTTIEVIQLSLFLGITGAAMLSAMLLIRERARTAAENVDLRTRVAELDNALQRADALLNLRDQRILVWFGDSRKAELVGTLAEAPEDRATFLAFGRWLAPRSAAQLERAVADLREQRQNFDLVVETTKGNLIEVQGRAAANNVAIKFLSLSEAQREHAELRLEHQQLRRDHDNLLGLLHSIPTPVWLRGPEGRLVWVNQAYADAVEAADPLAAASEGVELFGTGAREQIARDHLSSPVFSGSLSTVIGGDRRVFSVTDFSGREGSAGFALDISEAEAARTEHQRTLRGHAETLDRLNTAVAIFDANQDLRFYNQAFQKLWELDISFLNSKPDNTVLLDRLRSECKLAEQPEWRRWKENLLSAYRSVEPLEDIWHLPDGQTLRVVGNPQADGGVTWVFENLTEKISLESRYNTVVRVQGVTLDNLAEGVAVFGSDGRVRLSNPAFCNLWGLPEGLVTTGTHISAIKAACQSLTRSNPWSELAAAATGFDEERRDGRGQVELNNGNILSYAIVHLPNGQLMTTFFDVTDSVNVERMLKERNEALERTDRLKNDFIQHVSYELRSPLTNIIGFAELLAQETAGPLNQRQRDYVEHIASSSSELETIVDDIIDLATVDAGMMELNVSEVPIERIVHSAAEVVEERMREHGIALEIDLRRAPATFHADENRVRQILINLLSNAANFAPDNSVVKLICERDANGLAFSVHDDGPGIPPDVLDGIFRRFEPRANGGRRRGAGLGLSIVKSFVGLHNGTVEFQTDQGRGTTVICRFPMAPEGFRAAAE
ncbi:MULTISPECIES: PAS domain-containing sensor histidine kinase [unclassified Aminobacter]|uniref:sensor histidine kinase n=1 Tax=unclassified Aminobacter TaxID=2644704 RepID=UPI0004630AF1|nr:MULTISPECIES: PAS domain-containing sensor histidine kinase [unclassified Aminobacter]TWH36287.1 PAS domain-containing protein [Aminobacter sp. J15]